MPHRMPLFAMHSFRFPAYLALSATLCVARFAFADEPMLPGIGAAMQEIVAKNEIACAVTVVVAKDSILHLESASLADVAAKRPMTRDTLFWNASMTKPFSGTAILILEDEGQAHSALATAPGRVTHRPKMCILHP